MVAFIDHVQLIVLIIKMCTRKAVGSYRPLLTLIGVNVFTMSIYREMKHTKFRNDVPHIN